MWEKSLVLYFFFYFVTHFRSLFQSSNTLIYWFLGIFFLVNNDVLPQRISNNGEDTLLFSYNLSNCSSFSWLLAEKIKLRSDHRFFNALISYILKVFFLNFRANFHFFLNVILDLFPYPSQTLFSFCLFYFISNFRISRLIVSCILDSFSS